MIRCTIPYQNELMIYTQKCKLYENKFRDRKCNLSPYYFPVTSLQTHKNLIERFLNNSCTVGVPSYQNIKDGKEPIILQDEAVFC